MAETSKISDVAKPGGTAPSPTSRPIIVGHGSRIKQDPMMQTAKISDEEPKASEEVLPQGKTLTPTENLKKADEPKAEPVVDKKEEPKVESSEAAEVDVVVDQATDKKKDAENKESVSQEDKARRQHVDSMVSARTYFLPIGKATRKKQARSNLVAGLILLLLVAGSGYYAYHIGLLKSFL